MRKVVSLLLTILLVAAVPGRADRLFTCGFEHGNLDATARTEATPSTLGSPIINTNYPHSGSRVLLLNPSTSYESARMSLGTGTTSGTYYTQFYFRFTSLPPSGSYKFYINQDASVATDNHYLTISSTGQLVLTNAPTSETITATTTIQVDTWYSVGITHVVSNTVGTLSLKVNCNSEGTPLISVDTLATDVGTWVFGAYANSTYEVRYDDIVVNDNATNDSTIFQTAPACPNHLDLLEPASDNSVTWTKNGTNCSGTTNTDCVDDLPGVPDELNGYNSSSTNNNEDRFDSSTFSGGPDSDDDIISVYVKARTGGSSSSGTNTMRLLLWDESGSQTAGPTTTGCDISGWRNPIDPTVSYTHISFDAGTKTKANIESFDWGYEPVSVGQSCRVGVLWAYVEWAEYTAAACAAGQNIALLGVGCR